MTENELPGQPGRSQPTDQADHPDRCAERISADVLSTQRVFKKTSPNNKLTLYLTNRDLGVSGDRIDKVQGVLVVDPEHLQGRKVFGQVTLTFRYGREDEEVMGLKFCNEAVMSLAQLYPPPPLDLCLQPTPLQEALLRRLGPHARPFTLELTPLAPPSVQLVPAKQYSGAPIGTSYDVRAYVGAGGAARGRVHVLQRQVQERGGGGDEWRRVPAGPRLRAAPHLRAAAGARRHQELDRARGFVQPCGRRAGRHRGGARARLARRAQCLCHLRRLLRQGEAAAGRHGRRAVAQAALHAGARGAEGGRAAVGAAAGVGSPGTRCVAAPALAPAPGAGAGGGAGAGAGQGGEAAAAAAQEGAEQGGRGGAVGVRTGPSSPRESRRADAGAPSGGGGSCAASRRAPSSPSPTRLRPRTCGLLRPPCVSLCLCFDPFLCACFQE